MFLADVMTRRQVCCTEMPGFSASVQTSTTWGKAIRSVEALVFVARARLHVLRREQETIVNRLRMLLSPVKDQGGRRSRPSPPASPGLERRAAGGMRNHAKSPSVFLFRSPSSGTVAPQCKSFARGMVSYAPGENDLPRFSYAPQESDLYRKRGMIVSAPIVRLTSTKSSASEFIYPKSPE